MWSWDSDATLFHLLLRYHQSYIDDAIWRRSSITMLLPTETRPQFVWFIDWLDVYCQVKFVPAGNIWKCDASSPHLTTVTQTMPKHSTRNSFYCRIAVSKYEEPYCVSLISDSACVTTNCKVQISQVIYCGILHTKSFHIPGLTKSRSMELDSAYDSMLVSGWSGRSVSPSLGSSNVASTLFIIASSSESMASSEKRWVRMPWH